MKANLRVAATFNAEVSSTFGVPGLRQAIIVDDEANLLHDVEIEYEIVEKTLYRRLTYSLVSMPNMQKVFTLQNDLAQQLLNKIALALAGSTLSEGRAFEKTMLVLPKDEFWDDVLPSDKDNKVKPKKVTRKAPAKKASTKKAPEKAPTEEEE